MSHGVTFLKLLRLAITARNDCHDATPSFSRRRLARLARPVRR